jgi:hypothetical protein
LSYAAFLSAFLYDTRGNGNVARPEKDLSLGLLKNQLAASISGRWGKSYREPLSS